MIRLISFSSVIVIAVLFMTSQVNAKFKPFPAPEFTQNDKQSWINSKPLRKSDLLGKVTLIDVWTFDCWNCYRSFPWLNSLEKQFEKFNFQTVGIHSPEFAHEKKRHLVERKAAEFKLSHPIMMDNDFSYWKALKNQYWPSFYLVDKQGEVRFRFIGETHSNTAKSNEIEAAIRLLLNE